MVFKGRTMSVRRNGRTSTSETIAISFVFSYYNNYAFLPHWALSCYIHVWTNKKISKIKQKLKRSRKICSQNSADQNWMNANTHKHIEANILAIGAKETLQPSSTPLLSTQSESCNGMWKISFRLLTSVCNRRTTVTVLCLSLLAASLGSLFLHLIIAVF